MIYPNRESFKVNILDIYCGQTLTNRTFIYFCVSLHFIHFVFICISVLVFITCYFFSGHDTTIAACNAVVKTITIKTLCLFLRVQTKPTGKTSADRSIYDPTQDIFWERFQAHFFFYHLCLQGKKMIMTSSYFPFLFFFFPSMLIFFCDHRFFSGNGAAALRPCTLNRSLSPQRSCSNHSPMHVLGNIYHAWSMSILFVKGIFHQITWYMCIF